MPRMTKPTDHTLAVLKQIRDAVTLTNVRLDQTRQELSQRLDQTNERLDHTNERLEHLARLHTETEIRLSTELSAVIGAVHTVRDAVTVDLSYARRWTITSNG
jgi:hypothetical protein